MMINSINAYLDELKKEMHGLDSSTIQDALGDAEEHLRTAFEYQHEQNVDLNDDELMQMIIEQYGSPSETAAAYAEVERRTFPGLVRPSKLASQSLPVRFFRIYTDPKTWGALLYMLVSFVTGIVYFTWAVVGLSLSISFAIFIFGLPFTLFFLISVRGIALLEGRLVEALLGVRMPRRPIFSSHEGKWLQQLKNLLLNKHTWMALIYMVLQLLFGILYFTMVITLLSLSLSGFAIPVVQLAYHLPVVYMGNIAYTLPNWALLFCVLAGFLLLTITMYSVRGIGYLHGKYAKFILVEK